jgi:methylated-DNA-[protein]-cysteine S-methyltransferase
MMTTNDGQPAATPTAILMSAADQPDVDPCDVACEAMPAMVIGDLTTIDAAWLVDHTAGCGSCARELDRFEHVSSALDQLYRPRFEASPPPFEMRPPTRPRSRPVRRAAHYTRVESPVGPLLLAASADGICEIDFAGGDDLADGRDPEARLRERLAARGFEPSPLLIGDAADPSVARATGELAEYFAGRRDRFDVAVDLSGLTPFTQSVLEATARVPFGRLDTYRGIATTVGNPAATRAVGNALGRNPVPVIVPCHRIVRSDHSLGGYTGGLAIKEHLLALEGVRLA